MPVCTWCGIESKSDLVCDWCKRPLALRAMRKSGDSRSAVDLLRDGDDDRGHLGPRMIIAAGAVGVLMIIVVIWALTARQSAPEPASSAMSQEYSVTKEQAFVPKSSAEARPAAQVFMPTQQSPDVNRVTGSRITDTAHAPTSVSVDSNKLTRVALYNDNLEDMTISGPSVKLSGGILKTTGSRRPLSVGRITVTNTTESSVVELRLEAVVGGRTYTLQPFEGTPEKPRDFKLSSIDAGERITIPVLLNGYGGGRKPTIVPARILMTAWLNSGPGTVRDELLVP